MYIKKQRKKCIDCTDTPELAEKVDLPKTEMEDPTEDVPEKPTGDDDNENTVMLSEMSLEPDDVVVPFEKPRPHIPKPPPEIDTRGHVSYIEHEIQDGYLEPIIDHVVDPKTPAENGTEAEIHPTRKETKRRPSHGGLPTLMRKPRPPRRPLPSPQPVCSSNRHDRLLLQPPHRAPRTSNLQTPKPTPPPPSQTNRRLL